MWVVILPVVGFVAFVAGGVFGNLAALDDARAIEQKARAAMAAPVRLEIEVKEEGGRRWGAYLSSLPAWRIVAVLERCAGGRAFSLRALEDLLTRAEFESLRDELMARGFVAWAGADYRQGVAWTASGRALLRYVQRDGGTL
jgi:hypothetical protein